MQCRGDCGDAQKPDESSDHLVKNTLGEDMDHETCGMLSPRKGGRPRYLEITSDEGRGLPRPSELGSDTSTIFPICAVGAQQ
eukprot:8731422-Pyramimonas_sp.AAC.1